MSSFNINSLSKLSLIICFSIINVCHSATFKLPPKHNDIIGQVRVAHAGWWGESLWQIGKRYDIGIDEMIRANPGVKPKVRLPIGKSIKIPSQFILPPGPRSDIVINLTELRLYYFPPGKNIVMTFPIGIGKKGWMTPIGSTTITHKLTNPNWYPTAAVKAEALANGYKLPAVFLPGKNNPLGPYALSLAWPTYLIHGTIHPEGVGARVSAGCIRMFNKDVATLFTEVNEGTNVRITNEPFKIGWYRGELYMQAYKPLDELAHEYGSNIIALHKQLEKIEANCSRKIAWNKTSGVEENQPSTPTMISVHDSDHK